MLPLVPPDAARSEDAEDDRSEEDEGCADGDEIQRLDEGHWVASLCFHGRILTPKGRYQNRKYVVHCGTFKGGIRFDFSFRQFYQSLNHEIPGGK
jgi:hypothetical protein